MTAAQVLLLAVASSAAAQNPSDPVAALRQQVAQLGLLAWSPQRPVGWSDFRASPQPRATAAAETTSNFLYYIACHDSVAAVAVVATFWPSRSWVRPEVLRQAAVSAHTLVHERGHFNISEIFARRFRRGIGKATGLCPNRSYEAGRLFDRQNAANEEMQARYDRETAHGLDHEAQVRWDSAIRASLDSLGVYAGHE